MNAQELMSPRFEVVAEYPKCEFKKGAILRRIKYATNDIFHIDEYAPVGGLYLSEMEEFPHLFRKMNWWEKRKEEDMPKKVISKCDNLDTIYEIESWDMEILVGWINVKQRSCCSLLTFKPEYGYFPID